MLIGEAVLAEREGSVIQQQMMALTVEAPVADIPASIEVDISEVTIDTPIRVGQIQLGSNVVAQVEDDADVVVAQRSRASIAAEGVEGEEGVEGAEDGEEGAEVEASDADGDDASED